MTVDIERAWKDPEYRKSLTPEELASVPPNPAGDPELSPLDLEKVSGGGTHLTAVGCGGCKGKISTYEFKCTFACPL
jgi:mersacidin/lichenicidin family type 2 lantibiotic